MMECKVVMIIIINPREHVMSGAEQRLNSCGAILHAVVLCDEASASRFLAVSRITESLWKRMATTLVTLCTLLHFSPSGVRGRCGLARD
jgi:hypothetical protein